MPGSRPTSKEGPLTLRELAQLFLSDEKHLTQERRDKLAHELAQEIQRTIEDFIEAECS